MKGPQETDKLSATIMITRQFDRRLDAFGARIGHEGDGILFKGGDQIQLLTQFDPLGMVVISRNMDKFFCLLLDSPHDLWMAVPRGSHCDPGGKIQEPVPVQDRKSTRLNSSHGSISYAVFCLKKKKK